MQEFSSSSDILASCAVGESNPPLDTNAGENSQKGSVDRIISTLILGAIPGFITGVLVDSAYVIKNNQRIVDNCKPIFQNFPKTMRFAHVSSCALSVCFLTGFLSDHILRQTKDLRASNEQLHSKVDKLLKERKERDNEILR